MSQSGIKVRGFFRVNIVNPDGTVAGDSGWRKNQVTNLGIKEYLCDNIGASAGSKQIGFIALGTGGAPASNATTLPGEISGSTKREAVTYSNVSSRTAQFTATFASSDSFLGGSSNLSNIGLYNATTSNATLFAGNTYASSSCDTNQNVNCTYQIRFTSA